MEEPILSDYQFAKVKIERARRLALIFDQLDEKGVKEIFSCLYQAMKRVNKFDEKFYFVQDILNREIAHYGGIAKAYSWKDGVIIRRWDLLDLIDQIDSEI